MKRLIFVLLISVFCFGVVSAQQYDSVSGATQKADGKTMNMEQFKKVLGMKRTLVFSTVNEDGTPNAAVFGTLISLGDNVFAVRSMADTKTTKMNLKERKLAMLLLILDEKTEDGFEGAKVVLKYIENKDKIEKLSTKMEKSSERTSFFSVEKFLLYH